MTLHHLNQEGDPLNPDAAHEKPAFLLLEDGSVFEGKGLGQPGLIQGEVCFNTAMTGYQEILTDPSYDQQIVCFTFPHIGNTGVNPEDSEKSFSNKPSARGALFKEKPTQASNWRATQNLSDWISDHKLTALYGIDTRTLTHKLRTKGALKGLIFYQPHNRFSAKEGLTLLKNWSGLKGQDLATQASVTSLKTWTGAEKENTEPVQNARLKLAVIDFGIKTHILDCLSEEMDAEIKVFAAETPAREILKSQPDGIILSNGPGDPKASFEKIRPELEQLIQSRRPLLGICLGHQLLALALGAKTLKMKQGHHGANHPVKNLDTGQVEIVSMNHGFTVDAKSLPDSAHQTYLSLFDGSNCGFRLENHPLISVQHHPEASPGPHDARQLFAQFKTLIQQEKQARSFSETQTECA